MEVANVGFSPPLLNCFFISQSHLSYGMIHMDILDMDFWIVERWVYSSEWLVVMKSLRVISGLLIGSLYIRCLY